jgi:ribonuclease P protein component
MKFFGFPKHQRLSSKKCIENLFSSGKNHFSYPLKAIYIITDFQTNEANMEAVFVVPKKKFKKAVVRNSIRRKMREAFRLNKNELIEVCKTKSKQISIAFIFSATEAKSFNQIQLATQNIFKEISKEIQGSSK